MSLYDEYRVWAAECQAMADKTKDETEKRRWLKLAESWLRMSRDRAERPTIAPSSTTQTVPMQQQEQPQQQQQEQGKKLNDE
jgi:hypothetical protein